MEFIDPGPEYLHGLDKCDITSNNCRTRAVRARTKTENEMIPNAAIENNSVDHVKLACEWTCSGDGRIPCPPQQLGGCGQGFLELRCLFQEDQVSELLARAEQMAKKYKFEDASEIPEEWCSCLKSADGSNVTGDNLRKAAFRKDSEDNFLYCPKAVELNSADHKHFQCHWVKGEPVIVRNVLETTLGLSWEPMVMWRAFRQIKHLNHPLLLNVNAINCLDWCEVSLFTLFGQQIHLT